jgi:hypothetical protein
VKGIMFHGKPFNSASLKIGMGIKNLKEGLDPGRSEPLNSRIHHRTLRERLSLSWQRTAFLLSNKPGISDSFSLIFGGGLPTAVIPAIVPHSF